MKEQFKQSLTEKIREGLPTPRTLPGHIGKAVVEECLDGAELVNLYIRSVVKLPLE